MRTSCVHDVRTIDAERIDITVDSIKRYTVASAQCSEIHSPRNARRYVLAYTSCFSSSSFVIAHPRWHPSRLCACTIARPISRNYRDREERYLACTQMYWQRLRSNPALPRGWICLWDFHDTPRLRFSRAICHKRVIISVHDENRHSRRTLWHFNEIYSAS